MKLLLCSTVVVALFGGDVASGFSVSSLKSNNARTSSLIRLEMASSSLPPSLDGWSDKPAYERRSTTPVATKKVGWLEKKTMEDVMIDPDYFLATAVALLCPLIIWYHPSYDPQGGPSLIGIMGGGFHLLFAALLWVQTRRVRCVFERDAFEFYNIKGPHLDLQRGAWLEKKPNNYVSATRNRWCYDDITNYGFFPSLEYPVICYFKETATEQYKWNRWFAAFDSYGRGQPHFFPGICNARQFKAQMEARGVKRKPVPTLKKHD